MKNNMKGFTLVELLAVIVILAIVALVTTPAILNVINNSRRSGAEDKAWGTIDAVKLAYVQSQTLDNETELTPDASGNITVTFGTWSTTNKAWSATASNTLKFGTRPITVNGEMPSGGTVVVNTGTTSANGTGKITCKNLYFEKNGKYTCSTNDAGTKMCCESGAKENVDC